MKIIKRKQWALCCIRRRFPTSPRLRRDLRTAAICLMISLYEILFCNLCHSQRSGNGLFFCNLCHSQRSGKGLFFCNLYNSQRKGLFFCNLCHSQRSGKGICELKNPHLKGLNSIQRSPYRSLRSLGMTLVFHFVLWG